MTRYFLPVVLRNHLPTETEVRVMSGVKSNCYRYHHITYPGFSSPKPKLRRTSRFCLVKERHLKSKENPLITKFNLLRFLKTDYIIKM